jgi:hypothetical protein
MNEDQLRMALVRREPKLRREAAAKLIDAGMSQREAAKVLRSRREDN